MIRLVLLLIVAISAPASELEVLHWWTSASEKQAASTLKQSLASQDIYWRDAAIAGGAGEGAMKVLKSSILSGKVPDAAQIIGTNIENWTTIDMLQYIPAGRWNSQLSPKALEVASSRHGYVAVPLSIHQINRVFYNQALFDELELQPAKTWKQLVSQLNTIKQAGYIGIAHSDEPWQLATLFETLVLSVSDSQYYQQVFVKLEPAALADTRFLTALKRLRQLKAFMDPQYMHLREWQDATHMVAEKKAAMQFMGNWAKAELQQLDGEFNCVNFPDTEGKFIYSIDSLSFFTQPELLTKTANVLTDAQVQIEFAQHKGSIPAITEFDLEALDLCAQSSMQQWQYAQNNQQQVPSLTHRMAQNEDVRGVFLFHLQQFFSHDEISAEQIQKNLIDSLATFNHE